MTEEIDPNGEVTYTVYDDADNEVRVYPDWNTTTDTPGGPTQVTREDLGQRVHRDLDHDGHAHLTNGVPDGTEAISNLQISDPHLHQHGQSGDGRGRLFQSVGSDVLDRAVPGDGKRQLPRHPVRLRCGRQPGSRCRIPTGPSTGRCTTDWNRVVSTWVGTNDTPVSGTWSPSNPAGMVEVTANVYDNGGVGDGNLTQTTTYPGGECGPASHPVLLRLAGPASGREGRGAGHRGHDHQPAHHLYHLRQPGRGGGAADLRRRRRDHQHGQWRAAGPGGVAAAGQTITSYDNQGQVYQTQNYLVNQTTGAVSGTPLTTNDYYDSRGNQTAVTDPAGNTTTTLYDSLGQETTTIDALGNRTTTTYDVAGDVATETDALGRVTSYTYDAQGRQIAVTTAVGTPVQETTQTAYNAIGEVASTTDALGNVTTYGYDSNGNQTSVTDPLGHTTTTLYNAYGDVTETINPLGNPTYYGYDAYGNQTSVTDALGHTTTTVYDNVGEVVETIDPLGNITQNVYTVLGQEVESIDALGHATTYAYDTAGTMIAEVDPDGNETQWVYNSLGQEVNEIRPTGGVTTYGLRCGRQSDFGDGPAGEHDNHVVQCPGPGRPRPSTPWATGQRATYDAVGNLSTVTDALGRVTSYTYDAQNRETAVTTAVGTAVQETTRTAYNADNEVDLHDRWARKCNDLWL